MEHDGMCFGDTQCNVVVHVVVECGMCFCTLDTYIGSNAKIVSYLSNGMWWNVIN